MSGLAKYLLENGYEVSGSDINDSKYIDKLRALGAKVYIGHNEDNLPEDVKVIVEAQRISNHRWYSTAQMIVQCSDGYASISGAYQSFSEMQSWRDINVICTAGAIPQEESAVYDAMIKVRESRNKANEAKMKPTEREKPQMGTDVPKEKEKPVKASK